MHRAERPPAGFVHGVAIQRPPQPSRGKRCHSLGRPFCYAAIGLCIAFGAGVSSASAAGSTEPEQNGPTVNPPAPPSTTLTEEPHPSLLSRLGTALKRDGFKFNINLLDQALFNPDSGSVPNRPAHVLITTVTGELDLNKIAGIPGATVRFQEGFYSLKVNSAINATSGNVFSQSEVIKENNTNVLSLLTYEQKLFSDRVVIEGGRTEPQRYFFLANCDNPFECESTTLFGDAPVLPVRDASWGGKGTFNINDQWALQGGLFEDHFSNIRRNGLNWGTHGATGLLAVGEATYKTTFSDEPYPTRHEAGFFWDTSPHNDIFESALNRSVIAFPRDPKMVDQGPRGIFAEGTKVLWRPDGGVSNRSVANTPPANLSVYYAYYQALNGGQQFDADAWVGLSYTGLFASRPNDHFGLKLHWAQIDQREVEFEEFQRVHLGGPFVKQDRNEWTLELAGNFAIINGVNFIPEV